MQLALEARLPLGNLVEPLPREPDGNADNGDAERSPRGAQHDGEEPEQQRDHSACRRGASSDIMPDVAT
jgi:hypothetical protein